jgi:hypothetical protein
MYHITDRYIVAVALNSLHYFSGYNCSVTCRGVAINDIFDWMLNNSTIAILHVLQINITHAKSFPACYIFSSRFLITASNNGDSSASALKPFLNGRSFQLHLFFTDFRIELTLLPPIVFFITPRHGPRRQQCLFSNAKRFRRERV